MIYFNEQQKKIIDKPMKWETPNFIKNWEDYFGTMSFNPKVKKQDYNNKLFNQ